jgi:hypothetical protein
MPRPASSHRNRASLPAERKENQVSVTIDIHASNRLELDECLDAAEEQLKEIAMLTGTHGILVVRRQPGHYSAHLTPEVPFGTTQVTIS